MSTVFFVFFLVYQLLWCLWCHPLLCDCLALLLNLSYNPSLLPVFHSCLKISNDSILILPRCGHPAVPSLSTVSFLLISKSITTIITYISINDFFPLANLLLRFITQPIIEALLLDPPETSNWPHLLINPLWLLLNKHAKLLLMPSRGYWFGIMMSTGRIHMVMGWWVIAAAVIYGMWLCHNWCKDRWNLQPWHYFDERSAWCAKRCRHEHKASLFIFIQSERCRSSHILLAWLSLDQHAFSLLVSLQLKTLLAFIIC